MAKKQQHMLRTVKDVSTMLVDRMHLRNPSGVGLKMLACKQHKVNHFIPLYDENVNLSPGQVDLNYRFIDLINRQIFIQNRKIFREDVPACPTEDWHKWEGSAGY